MNKVHEFFRLIYSCADPEWFLEIRRLEPLPVTWHIDRVKNLESWVNEGLKMALSAQSLHFRVVPARTENRNDLAMATTLWADVERYVSEEEWEALRDLGIPPGAVVHSGRGMHIYWPLKSPTDIETAREKNEALAKLLCGDEGAGHPSHTLRFPGSYNCKYVPKRYVDVEIFGHMSDISDFEFLPKTKKKKATEHIRITAGFEQLEKKASLCPVLDTAFNSPENLSFYAWISLACLTDEETFVKISSLDAGRFNEEEARYRHEYSRRRNYRPYGCDKIPEARSCPRLGKCGLRKVIHE